MTGSTETQMLGGAGYGSGFGGIAPFGLFGLVGLGNNGLGYGNNANGIENLNHRFTDAQIAGVNTNINDVEANLTQATLMQTNNLGQLILDGDNGITNTVRTAADVLYAQTAGVKDAVQNVQFQNALQGKDFANSQCVQTQTITEAIRCEAEKTRAEATARYEAGLLTEISDLKSERDLLATGNFPVGQPVHVDRWHGNAPISQEQISIIVQNGLANFANQVPHIVAAEVAKLSSNK